MTKCFMAPYVGSNCLHAALTLKDHIVYSYDDSTLELKLLDECAVGGRFVKVLRVDAWGMKDIPCLSKANSAV